jgi:serine/threonine protein kinase
MQLVKAPHAEPIAGYRLLEPLGKGGFGEVWKCEAPGGLHKAIKFLRGRSPDDPHGVSAEQELGALQLMKTIRHPFLLSIERIEVLDGEAAIVMELADRSLHDLLQEKQAAGYAGIARAELLGYLREAAEAIDLLNQEYGLQHLDIKPQNLFLIGRHVKVADFGLMASLSELQDASNAKRRGETLTPLYAAPETFLGRFTLFSDQYSLAVVYQEMLTGTLPFGGTSYRQLALQHVRDTPDGGKLPPSDRPIVARALSKEPRERFPSCCCFIQALVEAGSASSSATSAVKPRPVAPPAKNKSSATYPKVVVSSSTSETTAPPSETNKFLPGHHLLECLHRQPGGEVWTAQTSDGRKKLVRIIYGYDPAEERPEGDALDRLRKLRHPALPRFESVAESGARLALLTDLPDSSLADRLRERRQIGQDGLPRPELLSYLRQAAEALDDLYEESRLQHLGLTPRHLALRGGRLYLLDFALAELFWLPAGNNLASLNPRYAAPELFEGQIGRRSDQYSLALIYQELLTGIHPFRNVHPRQLALPRHRGKPDLSLLPTADRAVIAQALHLDPDCRYPTCSALVDALETAATKGNSDSSSTNVRIATLSVAPAANIDRKEAVAPTSSLWSCTVEEMKQFVAKQVDEAAEGLEVHRQSSLRYRVRRQPSSDSIVSLEHHAHGRIVPATLPLKLGGFEAEWKPQRLKCPEEPLAAADDGSPIWKWLYQFSLGGGLLKRYLGRKPSLLLEIELKKPRFGDESMMEVLVRLIPSNCGSSKDDEILNKIAPHLLRSLRDYLQLLPDQRAEERFAWKADVQVQPIRGDAEFGEAFVASAHDLCTNGIGLEFPCRPVGDYFSVRWGMSQHSPLALPLKVLHAHSLSNGRTFVGGRFAWEMVSPPSS